MGGFEPRVETVRVGDRSLLAKLVALYLASFPESERKPAAFLREAAERDDYTLLAVMTEGGPEGLALVYRSPSGDFSLLEYMAISAEWRGRGLGAALFRAVAERNVGRALLLEVEAEEAGEPLAAQARRRKSFYRNLGCRELQGLDYRMPKVSSGTPPPMSLLACGSIGPRLAKSSLRTWLREIFGRVYSVRDPERPLDLMLADCPEEMAVV